MRLLVVTAVLAERDAVLRELAPLRSARLRPYPETRIAESGAGTVVVVPGGVGPAATAAAAVAANRVSPDVVVSMGVAGGFAPRAAVGDVLLADPVVAADLGAESPDGFLDMDALGLGPAAYPPPAHLRERVRALLATAGLTVAAGPLLTVATVTGTRERADQLSARHPGTVGEAMEGYGVAAAAAAHGVPALEVRTVSNPVGVRDRASWELGPALEALGDAAKALFSRPWEDDDA